MSISCYTLSSAAEKPSAPSNAILLFLGALGVSAVETVSELSAMTNVHHVPVLHNVILAF